MRVTFLTIAIAAFSLLSVGSTQAEDLLAPGITNFPQAPIGHLQPRADNFMPQSAANRETQEQIAKIDAEQARQDRELNRKLNICRRC
jgi:Spy/CpxP family protein refolding chaperone